MNRKYPAVVANILFLLSASSVMAQAPEAVSGCAPDPEFFKGLLLGVGIGFTISWLFFRQPFSGQSHAAPAADSDENPVVVPDSVPETSVGQCLDAAPDSNSKPLPNFPSDVVSDAASEPIYDLTSGAISDSTSDSLPAFASENIPSAIESPAVPVFVADAARREKYEKWLIALGGPDNIVSATACAMTRIRLVLRKSDSIEPDKLLAADVMGVMALKGEVLHLIVGFAAPAYETELQQLLNSRIETTI